MSTLHKLNYKTHNQVGISASFSYVRIVFSITKTSWGIATNNFNLGHWNKFLKCAYK